jgi:hypothetical protein
MVPLETVSLAEIKRKLSGNERQLGSNLLVPEFE